MTINQVWNQRELKMNKKSSTSTQFNNILPSQLSYGLFHLIKENLNTLDSFFMITYFFFYF